MTTDTAHQHLAADELIRLLDDALDANARTAAQHALDRCDICREHARALQQRTSNLDAALRRTDFAAPNAAAALAAIQVAHAHRSRAQWRITPARMRLAAAIALVVLAGALAVTPAAAWLARIAERAWHAITPAETTTPATQPVTPTPSQTDYRYVPAAGVLTLRFAASGDDQITIAIADDEAFALSVEGGNVAGVVLLPDEVQVENSSAAARRFQITVPRQVSALRVIAGNAAPVTFTHTQLQSGITRVLRDIR